MSSSKKKAQSESSPFEAANFDHAALYHEIKVAIR